MTGLVERLEIAATPAGVVRLGLGRGRSMGEDRRARRWAEQARVELAEYLAGRRAFFTVPVDLGGLGLFQREVLEMARAIPFGEVRSYRSVAEAIGRPGAARAVGRALGANPVPILVPCHRVVPAGGGSGGYIFGGEVKARLLNLERSTPALVGSTRDRTVCRLGCPSSPRKQPGVFFTSLAEARATSYRPCPLCHPFWRLNKALGGGRPRSRSPEGDRTASPGAVGTRSGSRGSETAESPTDREGRGAKPPSEFTGGPRGRRRGRGPSRCPA